MPSIKDIMQTMEYGPAPESNSEVLAWLESHQHGLGHYINGAFTAAGGDLIEVVNPAEEKVIARVAKGRTAEVDAAVAAARAAFPAWSALPGHERAKYLYAIARHLQKRERFFSVLETMDNGKTIRETRDIDIPLAARHFYHHAGWAELAADAFPNHTPVASAARSYPGIFRS